MRELHKVLMTIYVTPNGTHHRKGVIIITSLSSRLDQWFGGYIFEFPGYQINNLVSLNFGHTITIQYLKISGISDCYGYH